ncbi:MAG: phosphoribosyltransferase family protein [Balneolaceae bacterium]
MILLDQRRLDRILNRMAFQVIEKSKGQPVDLIGLNTRGYAVAKRIAAIISENSGGTVNLQSLSVNSGEPAYIPPMKNSQLLIVDDVVYSGATMFRALTSIEQPEDYDSITVAAVVDRGHRKLPVGAGIVGIKIPTKVNEHVEFQLKEGQPHSVFLTKQ